MRKTVQETNARIEAAQRGTGRFIYENNTKGDLMLPRPTAAGIRRVGYKMQFEGDDYYMSLVRSHDLRLIKAIETPKQEQQVMDEKLLTEQPDVVTTEGTVEFVKSDKSQVKLNENEPHKNAVSDVLINESPMAGIELI